MVHHRLPSLVRCVLAASSLALIVACGAKASDEADIPPPATNPTRGPESAPAPPLGGGATTPAPPAGPADPGAKPADPGPAPVDPGKPVDPAEPTPSAGTKCSAGAIGEAEPNDAPEQANAMTKPGSFCGQLAVGDVDHVKFTLPADATSLSLSGATTQAHYEMMLEVDGAMTPMEGAIPFKAGMEYVIKVTNTGQADLDYRVDVVYK